MGEVTSCDVGWLSLGAVPATALREARLQIHWATQVVSALGKTFIAPRPDDSHPNLGYVPEDGLLMGHPTETKPSFRAALAIPTFAIRLLDDRRSTIDELKIDGVTLETAFQWLERAVSKHSGGVLDRPIDRTLYEIPSHPIGAGEPFTAPVTAELLELRAWYHNSDLILQPFVSRTEGASSVRTWPHHFDIGTLVMIDGGADPESARSVGIGMTPGDDYYSEPYFYVNPYPEPKDEKLPQLPAGAVWHHEDWFGAVLTGSTLAAVPAGRQEETLNSYLDVAFEAANRLLRR